MSNRRYGYVRVSTKGQAKDGNSLEAQEKALRDAGAEEIFADSYTGTKTDRPEFQRLLGVLEPGDTLMVTKLDRFARSMAHGSELVTQLIERGVKVYILNIGMMDNTPSSKLIRNIFFSFAEFERDMILERTREGKEIAKQNPGYREGRKPIEVDHEMYSECRASVESGSMTVTEACGRLGISRAKWYRMCA